MNSGVFTRTCVYSIVCWSLVLWFYTPWLAKPPHSVGAVRLLHTQECPWDGRKNSEGRPVDSAESCPGAAHTAAGQWQWWADARGCQAAGTVSKRTSGGPAQAQGGGLCPLAARELETENMLYFSCTSYQHCNKLCMSTWNIHCTTASVLYMNMKCN